jgi:hypothetical protein
LKYSCNSLPQNPTKFCIFGQLSSGVKQRINEKNIILTDCFDLLISNQLPDQ